MLLWDESGMDGFLYIGVGGAGCVGYNRCANGWLTVFVFFSTMLVIESQNTSMLDVHLQRYIIHFDQH